MKRYFAISAIVSLIFLGLGIKAAYLEESWKEVKGDHFIVYYAAQNAFAQEVLRKAEQYYEQISGDLGYQRYSNFWQWENRVKIYIYKTQEDFLKGTGRKEWSHGYANYTDKEIRSYEWKEGFLESLLPHEITHLIFRDYVGFSGEVPIWLDEGVAQWEEPEKRKIVRSVMKYYIKDGRWYSITDLTSTDIRNVDLTQAVELFYVQAASIVDFLVSQFGAEVFIFFCRQLRDGKSMNETLRFAYPTEMRNVKEMEEKWKKYILAAP